ncbi:MAG: S26 family signal peptidase [Armatimonadetes bacterium]|nr:S26 family signal peptidase [Armatimonadota bacterium]
MKPSSRRSALFSLLVLVALAAFFAATFRTVRVVGPSMEPQHPDGKRFLMTSDYWLVGPISKGDVVVIDDPEGPSGELVKRVYAMPGGEVPSSLSPIGMKQTVPKGQIYVLGDNRDESTDSRDFGTVPLSSVRGKCVHLWSWDMSIPFVIVFAGIALIAADWLLLRRLSKRYSQGDAEECAHDFGRICAELLE